MALSENITRDGLPRSHLMELPIELHIRIRNQVLADPDAIIKELRRLRLVCRTFNDIWSPVVMTNMVLFQTRLTNYALAQLRHIILGKSNTSTLAACTTLTIQNLCCVDTEPDRWYSDARRLRDQGLIAILKRMRRTLLIALFYFIFFTLTVYPIILGILYIATLPVQAIRHIVFAIPKFRARYYLALMPRKLDMPTVRCVRLLLSYDDSDWAIYRSTKILLSLPCLTELELGFADTTDLEYLVRCLAQLNRLHKLTLLPMSIVTTPPRLRCIAALISSNENLTHFDWQLQLSPDFSALFSDVPATKPLKLHHLSLSRGYTGSDALIPHIRSLTSVEFRSKERNQWCTSFSRAKIYPPTIKVELLDQELITFIRNHPGLVSLKLGSSTTIQGTREPDSSLLNALMRHSETLQQLFIKSKDLAYMLQDIENEANFLHSTGNLRELVLETDETLQQYQNPISSIYNERRILQVVAHLNHSLIIVIRTRDKAIFSLCVAFCRNSEDFLIRHLAGRIVYERALQSI